MTVRVITRMLTSAALRSTVKESEDKQAQTGTNAGVDIIDEQRPICVFTFSATDDFVRNIQRSVLQTFTVCAGSFLGYFLAKHSSFLEIARQPEASKI